MLGRGLQLKQVLSGKDWVLGGVNLLDDGYINHTGKWLDFIPKLEKQSSKFDTYACVSFSLNNVVEIYAKARYGIDINFSDRFLASMSGTQCNFGNYMSDVAETWRIKGAVFENEYPFIANSCLEYMQLPSGEIQEKGLQVFDEYDFKWAWSYDTTKNSVQETLQALKYSPVSVAIAFDYNTIKDGIFQRTEANAYHCVTIVDYEVDKYWVILDHYDWEVKKLAWDYKFHAKLNAQLIKKEIIKTNMLPEHLQKGTFIVQNTEGDGSFALLIDSKMYVDDLAEMLATLEVRKGESGGGLTKEVWDSLEKYNLKNEKI